MATIADGTTIRVEEDGGGWRFAAGDEDAGRLRGSRLEVGDLTADLVSVSERGTRVLEVDGRTPVLRLDRAGRKATWLTLSRSRSRLSRQSYRPFLRRWVLTRDVEGPAVLRVSTSPLGTRVKVDDRDGFTDQEVEALVAGALVVALDVPAEVREASGEGARA